MKLANVVFVEVDDVLHWHARGLASHGGQDGVRDMGTLQSAIMAPRAGYYTTLAAIASAYLFGIAKNHAFLDGNKRVAHVAAFAFLQANGIPVPHLDVDSWVQIVENVAKGDMGRPALELLFVDVMGGDVPIEED